MSSTRSRSLTSTGGVTADQTVSGPTASLSWLVFDIGGRSGSISSRRTRSSPPTGRTTAPISRTWCSRSRRAAFFNYVANRALRNAQQLTLQEAQTNYQATVERRRQGLATIADELQAKTQPCAGPARARDHRGRHPDHAWIARERDGLRRQSALRHRRHSAAADRRRHRQRGRAHRARRVCAPRSRGGARRAPMLPPPT